MNIFLFFLIAIPYICTMKHKSSLYILVFVLVLTACGSSRKAARQPVSYNQYDRQATQYVQPKKSRLTSEQRLAQRIDSLMQASAELLNQSQLGLQIVDLTSGQTVYSLGARQRMRPASTEKMVTAIAALDLLGPTYEFSTQLLTTAPVRGNTLQGDLYIKGTMDPLLSTADVRTLANQLRSAGIRTISGCLIADASMKDADEYGWGWCWDDDNPILSPLLCNGKPGLAAAMRTALQNAGISIKRGVTTGVAPAGARELTAFRRPLLEVMQPMMKQSDNLCAEAVFYQILKSAQLANQGRVLPRGKHFSRNQIKTCIEDLIKQAYGMQSLPGVTRGMGNDVVIADGSGLSLYNYQTPETFIRLLTYAVTRRDFIFNPLLQTLPIAGLDGTLRKRMIGTPAAQNVRAKTGSVTSVSTLVGYTTQRSTGHLIAFAIMNQGVVNMAQGRSLQDKLCVLMSE